MHRAWPYAHALAARGLRTPADRRVDRFLQAGSRQKETNSSLPAPCFVRSLVMVPKKFWRRIKSSAAMNVLQEADFVIENRDGKAGR